MQIFTPIDNEQHTFANDPWLYTDLAFNFQLLYAPNAEKAPLQFPSIRANTYKRLVTSESEFKEKQLMFLHGYDDAILEWLKIQLLKENPSLAAPLRYHDHGFFDQNNVFIEMDFPAYNTIVLGHRRLLKHFLSQGFYKVDSDFIYYFMIYETANMSPLFLQEVPPHILKGESFYIESPLHELEDFHHIDLPSDATGFLGFAYKTSKSLQFHVLGCIRKQEGRYYMMTNQLEKERLWVSSEKVGHATFDIIYAEEAYKNVFNKHRQNGQHPFKPQHIPVDF